MTFTLWCNSNLITHPPSQGGEKHWLHGQKLSLFCKEGMIQYEANFANFANFEDTPLPASVTGIQARTALSLTCENLHNMKDDLLYYK